MRYLVDGYNLLFRTFFDRAEEDLKTLREQIIADLSAKASVLNIDITLVFDASFREGELTLSHSGHITILFTAWRETADDFIVNKLSSKSLEKSQEIVVTSDKRLASHVRNLGIKTLSVKEFLSWLNKAYKTRLHSPKKQKEKIDLTKQASSPSQMPLQGNLEYYRETFETRYQVLVQNEKKHQKPKKKS